MSNSSPTAGPALYTPSPALMVFTLLCGVLLPLVALGVELKTQLSRSVFFDPVPGVFHGVLICAVPLANAMLLLAQRRAQPLSPQVMLLVSFATGIAGFYALLYLPLTPLAPVAVLWYGLGLLILSPLLSLISLVKGRKRLQRLAPWRYLWPGIGLALAALLAADLPSTVTRIGMRMAASDSAPTQLTGVRFLRALGSERAMLGLCYPSAGMSLNLAEMLLDTEGKITPELARSVFYRVTGAPFNSHPAPQRRTLRNWDQAADEDIGGATVGGRAAGVSLAASRMDGSLDANAATAYLEWTMVFRNSSPVNQEARAHIALPPGAVVSRLTLWIDGEEREAAFGGRAQVRQAYQAVVRRNRDPVLVTTAGRDRVLVQLFPIPGRGGEMKVRIGITAPLALAGLQAAQLQLPAFSERNFAIADTVRHAVWLESAARLQGAALREQHIGAGAFALRGDLAEPAPGQAAVTITAARAAASDTAWSSDPVAGDGSIVVQRQRQHSARAPARIALVVDGSVSMAGIGQHLFKSLAALPADAELALVMAGDGAPEVVVHDRARGDITREHIEGFHFEGGRDNSAALAAAWDWASQQEGSAMVWVHGPQPLASASTPALLQRLERQPKRVTLYDLAAVRGPDAIGTQLDGLAQVRTVARRAALHEDLAALFAQWRAGAMASAPERARSKPGALPAAIKTSPHLARLWAADQVTAMLESGEPAQRDAATALALRYQLVTPVSGAVVLETRAQYQAAGLEPVPAGSVPTIPEPETWLMMIVALCVLAWRLRRRQAGPAGLSAAGQPA